MEKERLLRLTQVIQVTGLSRSTLYKQIKDNTFPKQIKLGARAVGWLSGEIEQWVAKRIAVSRSTDVNPHSDDLPMAETSSGTPSGGTPTVLIPNNAQMSEKRCNEESSLKNLSLEPQSPARKPVTSVSEQARDNAYFANLVDGER